MIIDCQLNSLLENCLKTQLVGFRWAGVLGLKPKSWGAEYVLINIGHTYFLFSIPGLQYTYAFVSLQTN